MYIRLKKFISLFKVPVAFLLIGLFTFSSFFTFNNQPLPIRAEGGGIEEEEEEEEEEEIEYYIGVDAKLAGEQVSGVKFNLNGPAGVTKSIESVIGEPARFIDLAPGNYTINIDLSTKVEYKLLDASTGSRIVNLTSGTPSVVLTYTLAANELPVDENLDSIKNIVFPENLTKTGTSTTNLAEIADRNPSSLNSVANFTFEDVGKNKITYKSPLDLSNFNQYSRINNLANFLDLSTVGIISFDTTFLTFFDAEATITMSGLNLVEWGEGEPVAKIYRDNQEYLPENMSYASGKLTFDVDGFSSYKIVPRLEANLDENEIDRNTETNEITAKNDVITLTVRSDNQDAKIAVVNNGEIVNFPDLLNSDGTVASEINLTEGMNRIRVRLTAVNGETVETFLNIEFNEGGSGSGINVSNIFSILFFLVILVSGVALGVIYLKNRNKSLLDKTDEQEGTTEDVKPKYNGDLLTQEEKELYGEDQIELNGDGTKVKTKTSASDVENALETGIDKDESEKVDTKEKFDAKEDIDNNKSTSIDEDTESK